MCSDHKYAMLVIYNHNMRPIEPDGFKLAPFKLPIYRLGSIKHYT